MALTFSLPDLDTASSDFPLDPFSSGIAPAGPDPYRTYALDRRLKAGDSAANDALNVYRRAALTALGDYGSQSGQTGQGGAVDAYDTYRNTLEDHRDQAIASVSPAVLPLLQPRLDQAHEEHLQDGQSYRIGQHRQMLDLGSLGTLVADLHDAHYWSHDPFRLDLAVARGDGEWRKIGQRNGWSAQEINRRATEWNGHLFGAAIASQFDSGNVPGARIVLAQANGQVDPATYARLAAITDAGANRIAKGNNLGQSEILFVLSGGDASYSGQGKDAIRDDSNSAIGSQKSNSLGNGEYQIAGPPVVKTPPLPDNGPADEKTVLRDSRGYPSPGPDYFLAKTGRGTFWIPKGPPPDGFERTVQTIGDGIGSGLSWLWNLPDRVYERAVDPSKRLPNGPENALDAAIAIFGGAAGARGKAAGKMDAVSKVAEAPKTPAATKTDEPISTAPEPPRQVQSKLGGGPPKAGADLRVDIPIENALIPKSLPERAKLFDEAKKDFVENGYKMRGDQVRTNDPPSPKVILQETTPITIDAKGNRTFTSTNPHVADTANALERDRPGYVICVECKLIDPKTGGEIGDIDILTRDAAIQVRKGDGGLGFLRQVSRYGKITGGRSVGFNPGAGEYTVGKFKDAGELLAKDLDGLLKLLNQ